MNKSLKLVVNNSFKIEDKKNFFEKKELEIILNLYAKMVSNGSWRDYGLSISSRQVSFSVLKIQLRVLCIKSARTLNLLIKILSISLQTQKGKYSKTQAI